MQNTSIKETTGAWLVHHGRKIALDSHGASDFPSIDESCKAADLLMRISATENITLENIEVEALAKAARLNPRTELSSLLDTLETRRLIQRQGSKIEVIGITTRGALTHAADIFKDANPSKEENAAIQLAEKTSASPVQRAELVEFIGDTNQLTANETSDFLNRAEQIGFVDAEGNTEDRLYFNGNLFKRDNIEKTSKVLLSLSSEEQAKFREFDELLKSSGCIKDTHAERILDHTLFEKLKAAGLYDLNTVSNDSGENIYITSPGAFHKFVDPLIDDCFDMAKALAAALTYGMTERNSSRGRIQSVEALLQKLINGSRVGPATAIGQDYRVLEQNRVVKIIPDKGLFFMELLKKEIGELALKVLTKGDANDTSLSSLPSAPMNLYIGPEESRQVVRKKQNPQSRKATQDILGALRGGRTI